MGLRIIFYMLVYSCLEIGGMEKKSLFIDANRSMGGLASIYKS